MTSDSEQSSVPTTDPARLELRQYRPGPVPLPWLRRAVILVFLLFAAYSVAAWAFDGLRSLLGTLFLAWLLAISMEPVVAGLARRGMRRGLATGLVLLAVAVAVTAFLMVFGSLLVDQITQLVRSTPQIVAASIGWIDKTFHVHWSAYDVVNAMQLTPARVQELATQLTGGVLGIVTSLVGLLFQGLTLLLFTFYLSADAPRARATVSRWFPPAHQRVIARVWETSIDKTGGYVVSRLILAGLSSFFHAIFFYLIGLPSWLPLALFTGMVSQFVPTIGTYIGIALPALVAVIHQPLDALWVVLFASVYQQVENYLFSPKVTARTVNIHPAVAFGAVLAGGALFGAMGALVSIPVVAAAQSLAETYGQRYELIDSDGDGTEDSAEPGTTQTGTTQTGTTQAGAAQTGTAQTDTAQTATARATRAGETTDGLSTTDG